MKLHRITFEFVFPDYSVYSTWWYPKWSDGFSFTDMKDEPAKYRVDINRGGGLKATVFTDHIPCLKNAKELIEGYLEKKNPIFPHSKFSTLYFESASKL